MHGVNRDFLIVYPKVGGCMKRICIVLMCILLSGVAHAGPFGTSEGDGIDRYPGAESLGDDT